MVLGGLEIWVWGLILSVGFVLSSKYIDFKEKYSVFNEFYEKRFINRINQIYSMYNTNFLKIIKDHSLEYLGECVFKINNVFHIGFILSTIYCIELYLHKGSFLLFSLSIAHLIVYLNIIFLLVHVILKFLYKKLTYNSNEIELNDMCEDIIEKAFKTSALIKDRSKYDLELKKIEKEWKKNNREEYIKGFKLDYLNDTMRIQKVIIYSFTSLLIGILTAFIYTSIILYGYDLYINDLKLKEPIIVNIGFILSLLGINFYITIIYELYKALLSKLHNNIILIVKRRLYMYDLLEINKDNLFTESKLISELGFNENLKYKDIIKLSDEDLALINLKIKVLDIIKNMEEQYVSRFKFLFYDFK